MLLLQAEEPYKYEKKSRIGRIILYILLNCKKF